MKITKIEIENLGPYLGKNTLNFSVEDSTRKVVLIGGKNGAGKTTLFNALRIGIYGCRAYGFESNNAKYLDIIAQLINASAKLRREGQASIAIDILMDDGKENNLYTYTRSWRLSTKVLKEELLLKRNDVVMSENERSDFESYLLQLIPPDMFRFYFFDGESISNFIFNGVRNTDFRNAFLRLCGLDTMEIVRENLLRISNIRRKDAAGTLQAYQEAKGQQEENESKLQAAFSERDALKQEIAKIDDALYHEEQEFLHRGGISKQEYQAMQMQISKEESKREATRRWLKETANDVIPFIILREQLLKLRERIHHEEQYQTALIFREKLNSTKTREQLIKTLSSVGIDFSEDLSDKIISVLTEDDSIEATKQILNLSKQESFDTLAKINNLLAFDVSRILSATRTIDSSLLRVKRIRKKLDKSDASNADSYFARKEQLLSDKQKNIQRLFDVEKTISALTLERASLDATVKKTQSKYEEFLKAKSVSDVTAKALLAFSDIQQRLYKKYVADVEKNFIVSFSSLINKSDLIDGIKIDEQLQVYPYKRQLFRISELKKVIQQSGENYFVTQFGSIAYEAYKAIDDKSTDEVWLPVEVKQQLSAGEKQIFIMALYHALAQLNKVSIPYIIDTPFARIDAEHRQKILNNFFMRLKGQIIILSTDEEIVGGYSASISDTISNRYLLVHAENEGTKIVPDTYFGG